MFMYNTKKQRFSIVLNYSTPLLFTIILNYSYIPPVYFFNASIYTFPYRLSATSFRTIVPIRIYSSTRSGFPMIFSPFSSLLITPELTVYPSRPTARLKSVARSLTLMFLFRSSVLNISSEK